MMTMKRLRSYDVCDGISSHRILQPCQNDHSKLFVCILTNIRGDCEDEYPFIRFDHDSRKVGLTAAVETVKLLVGVPVFEALIVTWKHSR